MSRMTITNESVRRGLGSTEQRLGVTLPDGFVEWLRSIYAEEEARPPWLWPANEWCSLAAYLDRIRRDDKTGRRGVVVGEEHGSVWLVAADALGQLANRATQVLVSQLLPRAEPATASEREPDAAAAAGAADEWVSHPKFGVGKIVEHPAPDRVKVEFPGGRRTLLRDKLAPAPAPAGLAPPAASKPAPIQPEAAESLVLRRYRGGEHVAVYDELFRERATDDVALGVAREMMRRARANLERLAERWRELGNFALRAPFGPTRGTQQALAALEKRARLPTTLRAFYLEFGFVDFVEPPSEGDWPSHEALDAIEVLPPDPDAIEEDDDGRLVVPLFRDNDGKAGYGGVGAVSTLLDPEPPAFDCELAFEGERIGYFVPYLRRTILEGGGMGPSGVEEATERLLRELTAGLAKF